MRKHKRGPVEVADTDAVLKNLIECAYHEGERKGLVVWTEDEAGPYHEVPYPGSD